MEKSLHEKDDCSDESVRMGREENVYCKGGGAIKKGQDRNPAPFLNPISYEKPNRIAQAACRKLFPVFFVKNFFNCMIINMMECVSPRASQGVFGLNFILIPGLDRIFPTQE
ncbi:MAG TPA: hypothetical protein VL832_13635 [Puia sp.]|nr:hypothetical protein [Puia sp.]